MRLWLLLRSPQPLAGAFESWVLLQFAHDFFIVFFGLLLLLLLLLVLLLLLLLLVLLLLLLLHPPVHTPSPLFCHGIVSVSCMFISGVVLQLLEDFVISSSSFCIRLLLLLLLLLPAALAARPLVALRV